jgi:hypothetical protein
MWNTGPLLAGSGVCGWRARIVNFRTIAKIALAVVYHPADVAFHMTGQDGAQNDRCHANAAARPT